MPETKVESDDDALYQLYHCKTPQVSNVSDVPHVTEVQLLEDLHEMWDGGWEIEFVFPSGTAILMRRRQEWIAKVDANRKKAKRDENQKKED